MNENVKSIYQIKIDELKEDLKTNKMMIAENEQIIINLLKIQETIKQYINRYENEIKLEDNR